MKETVEFRIPESYAKEFLDANDGVCLGGSVRKVEVSLSDPLFARIGDLDQRFQALGKAFFTAWVPRRRYTAAELRSAEWFRVIISRVFEPAGEECGTVYDEENRCEYCGSGVRQVSDLFLDSRSLPKGSDLGIAKTIAGEIIVSQSFVEVFQENKFKGAEFSLIKQRGKPSLILPGWYQMRVNSPSLNIVTPTCAGITPYNDGSERLMNQAAIMEQLKINGSWCEREGLYQCPLGHTIGLTLLSELTVKKQEGELWDIALTNQQVGVRRGLLRPEPLLVISRQLRELILLRGVKGMTFEVAHIVAA